MKLKFVKVCQMPKLGRKLRFHEGWPKKLRFDKGTQKPDVPSIELQLAPSGSTVLKKRITAEEIIEITWEDLTNQTLFDVQALLDIFGKLDLPPLHRSTTLQKSNWDDKQRWKIKLFIRVDDVCYFQYLFVAEKACIKVQS